MTDQYFDKLQLLVPFKGANGSADFRDYSPKKRFLWQQGATLPVISSAQKVFNDYGASGEFPANYDGTVSRLRTHGISIGTQPFTISFWVYGISDKNVTFFDSRLASETASSNTNNASGGFRLYWTYEDEYFTFAYGAAPTYLDGQFYDPNNPELTREEAQLVTGWDHIELSRDSSNNLRLFVNGIIAFEYAGITNAFNYTSCTIGGNESFTTRSSSSSLYMCDFALYVGVALHTAAFTPEVRKKTGYSISGLVTDAERANAEAYPFAFSRLAPTCAVQADDSTDGVYTVSDLVDDSHYVVCERTDPPYIRYVHDHITPV